MDENFSHAIENHPGPTNLPLRGPWSIQERLGTPKRRIRALSNASLRKFRGLCAPSK